jgi:hypothetical protein
MRNRFVPEGRRNSLKGSREEIERIQRSVEERFADQLKSAGWFRRFLILWRVRREISQEIEGFAPKNGLY